MAKRAIKGTVRGVAKEAVEKYIAPAPKTITYTKQVTPAPVPRYEPAPKEVAITKQAPVQIAPTITPPPTPRIVQATGGYQPAPSYPIAPALPPQVDLYPEVKKFITNLEQSEAKRVAGWQTAPRGTAPAGGITMTPSEQRGALGGPTMGLATPISSLMGGIGTPTELRAGFGYGVSSYQWTEQPEVLRALQVGVTPTYGADLAAQSTANLINKLNVWPSFFTPYVYKALGLTEENLTNLGYVADPSGNWVKGDWGPRGTEPGGGGGGGGGGTYGYNYGYPDYYGGGTGVGSGGYWGNSLIMWRIGL